MDSPATFPESPMEQDDAAYPCKGCGEILEEGKAFELARNRWHIDCFRCNTCGTLLDSDANLLLLGDGSLICNNCTYSCSSCGNKIEDLAILTGDQAFCASCFRCRNCKKKIENLRYARTSQGIFCMDCHESLMARRRKKTARNNAQKQQKQTGNGVHLDKSLPSLPPSALTSINAPISSFSPDVETPPSETYSDTPTEIPSRYRSAETRSELSKTKQRDGSPASQTQTKDTLTLPSSTYKNNRYSVVSNKSDLSGAGDGEFLIPLAFDPTSPATQPQRAQIPKKEERQPRDYFGSAGTRSPYSGSRKTSQDNKSHLHEVDSNQGSQPSSPHIAYQEKGRSDMAETIRRKKEGTPTTNGSATASPVVGNISRLQNTESPRMPQVARESPLIEEKFKLQDAPKHRKSSHSQKNSKDENVSPRLDTTGAIFGSNNDRSPVVPQNQDSLRSTPTETTKGSIGSTTINASSSPRPSYESRSREDSFDSRGSKPSPPAPIGALPKRGDSLDKVTQIPRKEVGVSSSLKSSQTPTDIMSDSPSILQEAPSPRPKVNGNKSLISNPIESPNSKSIFDTVAPLGHNRTDSAMSTPKESFTAPRAPPPPPDFQRHRNESVSTAHSELSRVVEDRISPTLPRYSAGGEFSLEEDMARILGSEESRENQESFLRRVSNSVRHGRSYSDKGGTRLSKEPKWPKSPINGTSIIGQEISSPITSSPGHRNELPWFRNEVLRQGQVIVEKDQKIAELEAALNATVDIKQVNTELREKRSTMIVLDAQKEIVIRELEILTDHIAATKTSGQPLDLGKMTTGVLRDFANSLEKCKDTLQPQIEDLLQKRVDLVEENSNLQHMKDKTLQEFEQLSLKNAQLAELNNQLVHQIQELYKANSGTTAAPLAPNGLGIYSNMSKGSVSVDQREMRPSLNDLSLAASTASIQQEEAEPVTVLQGPQVVNIRKGQPKKFNWKKGGHTVAKGVTKGLKGAFSSSEPKYQRDGQFAETMPYGYLTGGETPVSGTSFPRSTTIEPSRQGFGFFGNQKGPNKQFGRHGNGSSPQLVPEAPPAAQPANILFGSDLEQRVEFERTTIPGIVIRCIEEVELRGMDVEGIYRKSGGNSQILMVKEGFERDPRDYDLSDLDLDIHTVTSTLKQYFRKLPSPLITYEVYDDFLETNALASDPQQRIEAIRRAIRDLPPAHQDVLEFLVFHLKRVVERERENKMTSLNVAVVFAPTIMRPESVTREMTDTGAKNQAVQFLVENCHGVFEHEGVREI